MKIKHCSGLMFFISLFSFLVVSCGNSEQQAQLTKIENIEKIFPSIEGYHSGLILFIRTNENEIKMMDFYCLKKYILIYEDLEKEDLAYIEYLQKWDGTISLVRIHVDSLDRVFYGQGD